MSEVTGGMESGGSEGVELTENTGDESQAGAMGGQAGMSGAEQAQAKAEVMRELGEQDMDAMVTLKINGKDEKMPLREALKVSRMEKVSQAKMQEAAQIKNQAVQLMNLAKSDPRQFFKLTGQDPYEFAEATLAEKYNMMQMTPEQKRMMEYEQKLKQYEERENQEKKTLNERQLEQQKFTAMKSIESEFINAWKDSGLPPDKHFMARTAALVVESIAQKKAGLRDEALQFSEAVSIIKQEGVTPLRNILLSVAKTQGVEAAQKLLGDEMLKLFREQDIKRVTGNAASRNQTQSNRPGNTVSGNKNDTKSLGDKAWADAWKKL
jgi:DNA-binding ferritin-like protein (Dps family)